MREIIVGVPSEAAEYFISHFGLDGARMLGYHLTGEIIRCRDCKYYNGYHNKCHRPLEEILIDDTDDSIRRLEETGYLLALLDEEPDGFCNYARLRDG